MQASIWTGVETIPTRLVKPVVLEGAKKMVLSPDCRVKLKDYLITKKPQLPLTDGKLIPYPAQSPKVGKHLDRLENVFINIYNPSRDLETAEILATGLVGADKAEIAARIKSLREKGNLRVSLAVFLPEFIAKEMGVAFKCEGPNCYNTAMRFYGLENNRIETYDFEAVEYIGKKYKVLAEDEDLQFGDLIVFWIGTYEKGQQGNIRHTAVYMGKGLVLHKASTQGADPITFDYLENVLSYYRTIKYNDEGNRPHTVTFHRMIP
jgi:hypothetical protein